MQNMATALFGRSILVVGDPDEVCPSVTNVFATCGARVTAAHGAARAIGLLYAGDYDLVVLDMAAGPLDGWNVLHVIRELRPELIGRTILLTSRPAGARPITEMFRHDEPQYVEAFELDDICVAACLILADAGPALAA